MSFGMMIRSVDISRALGPNPVPAFLTERHTQGAGL